MKLHLWIGPAVMAVCAGHLGGQPTTIDLSRQARLGAGPQLPASCTVGQIFLNTSAPQGANLHVCASPNMWSMAGVPALSGDASGTALSVTVERLQGRKVDATAPGDWDVLRWDPAAEQWIPARVASAGSGVTIAGSTISTEDAVVPVYYTGTGDPTIDCSPGRDYYVDTAAGTLFFCKAPADWQPVSLPGHTHTADAIISGVLPAGRLPAGVVFTGQPNAFGAGQTQSVSHDTSNAGLRLAPAAGDPVNAQDGDVWYNVTSGKFRRHQNGSTVDWDGGGGGGVSTTQANTYAAGQKQSMVHDTSNAGLRLIPAAGDPGSVQDGDIWYNATSGKFRRRQNGATVDWDAGDPGTRAFNPHDTNYFWMIDEFTFNGGFSTANFGLYGWFGESIGAGGCTGSNSYTSTPLPNHPSTVTWATLSTPGTGCVAALDAGGQEMFPGLAGNTWQAQWTWLPEPSLLTSNFIVRAGLGLAPYNVAGMSGVMTRIDPAASADIYFDVYTSGTATATVDSGVVYDPNANSYTFKWRGDGNKFYWSVSKNGGAFSAEKTLCPAGCDMTGSLPTFRSTPFLSLVHGPNVDNAAKRLYIDRFSIDISGLSR